MFALPQKGQYVKSVKWRSVNQWVSVAPIALHRSMVIPYLHLMGLQTPTDGRFPPMVRVRHAIRPPTRMVIRSYQDKPSLADKAVTWLVPWDHWSFPGFRRGILAILGRSITWASVDNWRTCRKPMAPWAARVFSEAIRTRAMIGLQIADDLDAYAAEREAIPRR